MIPPEVIDQVRDAADLVQLIGEHVDLKRTGSDWRGPCPFHGGSGRNFSVVPRKQMYHCFVCHESGDVFTFFMKRFGLDYPSAVREIAGRVGVNVPESRQAGPDPNEPLYSALGVAAEWFARRLREHDDARQARDYLTSRSLGDATRDEFGLGYAPRSGEVLLESLRALGLEDDTLVNAGLAIRREDGSFGARFRGRLLFPIADVRGRVVGFGGRIIGDGEPKYLNSPESSVFHKGTLLYLLDRARGAIRTEEMAIVVEGYVDAIRLHAAGIQSAVAPLGTALTAEQVKVLRRYTKQVLLAYDADLPGLKSTFRAGDELLRQGATVQVLTMPEGEDPDTLVQNGGAGAFRELMAQAVDLFDRKVQLLERRNLFADTRSKRRALDRLLPTIRAAADPLTRDLYVARAAQLTGADKSVILQEAARGAGRGESHGSPPPPPFEGMPAARPAGPRPPEIAQERELVSLMLADASWLARGQRELTWEQFRHPHYRAIAQALMTGASVDDALLPLAEELGELPGDGFNAEAGFAAAAEWVRKRPERERLKEIDGNMTVADRDEKDRLFAEKTEMAKAGKVAFSRKAFKSEREPL